jgi:hypothetical protein
MSIASGAIKAGRAFVELYADATKLHSDLRAVEAKFKALGSYIANWGKAFALSGALALGPLLVLSKTAAAFGDNISTMSKRTGISAESLSAFSYIASQSGTTLDGFVDGIKNMQKTLTQAADGSDESTRALADLGMTVGNLRGLRPEEQFRAIADAVSKVADPSTRAAIAMKIFGRSGVDLLPLLMNGANGIDKYMARVKELGLVYSSQEIQAAADFNDKLSELWQVVQRAGFVIGSVLIPPLMSLANQAEKAVAWAAKFVAAHKELVIWSAILGASLIAVGTALYVAGRAVVFYGAAIRVLIPLMNLALTGIFSMIAAIPAPILWIAAALAAVGVAILWLSGAGGTALNWLGKKFGELRDFATDVFHGISDALIAGDIKLAADILWATLAVAWRTGVNVLTGIWLKFKLGMAEIWFGLIDGLKSAWTIFQGWLSQTMINTTAAVLTAIEKLKNIYSLTVAGAANIIAHKHINVQENTGELTHDQAEAAHKAIDDISTRDVSDINAQRDAALAEIEKNKKGALAANESQRDADLSAAGKDYNDKIAALKESGQMETVGGRMILRRLNEELTYLLNQAKKERAMSEGGPAGESPPDFARGLNMAKSVSFGTFSAQGAAAAGAVAGASALISAAQKTATNTDKTAKGVAKLVDQGGPTFT